MSFTAAPIPLYVLEQLESLNGTPKVSFPDSLSYPIVERVRVMPNMAPLPALGSADLDTVNFSTCKLTRVEIIGTDQHKKRVYTRHEIVPGYSKIIPFTDDETLTPGTITTQLVVKPSFPLTQAAGSRLTYQPINDYCGILTTQTLSDYASITRTITNPQIFTFPRLVFGVTPSFVQALDGTGRIVMNWNERPEFAATVDVTQVSTYNSYASLSGSLPALEYAPIFKALQYDGVFFNVNKSGVLCDAVTIGPYTTGTENPQWGYVVEGAYSATASSPSATAYTALANGTPRIVARTLEPWKYNLWRLTVTKVPLR